MVPPRGAGGLARRWAESHRVLDTGTYPPLGPLVAMSLDKAVGITFRAWPFWLADVALSAIGGFASPFAGFVVSMASLAYWAFAAYANAARLERPEYRMTGSRVLTLIGISMLGGLITEIGFFFLVIPGVWVGNGLSMSAIAAVADDLGLGDAFEQSWKYTTDGFWNTLGFNVVVALAMSAIVFVGYAIGAALIALIPAAVVGGQAGVLDSRSGAMPAPMIGLLFGVGASLYVFALSLAYQAHAVAQLHWWRGLKRNYKPIAGEI